MGWLRHRGRHRPRVGLLLRVCRCLSGKRVHIGLALLRLSVLALGQLLLLLLDMRHGWRSCSSVHSSLRLCLCLRLRLPVWRVRTLLLLLLQMRLRRACHPWQANRPYAAWDARACRREHVDGAAWATQLGEGS